MTRYLRQLRKEKRHGRGARYAALGGAFADEDLEKKGGKGHGRKNSKGLILLDQGEKSKPWGSTPPITAVPYASPGSATVFPIAPNFNATLMKSEQDFHEKDMKDGHQGEAYGMEKEKERDMGGVSGPSSAYGHGSRYSENLSDEGTAVEQSQRDMNRA